MKVLLVRLRQIGDVVFTTPTLAALANHFPGVELTYLVEPSAAPVVSGNPHVSRVLVAPRRPGIGGLLDDVRLGGELRRMRFDIVLDFHGGPRASLLTWLSRAPRRVGYEIKGRAWMYTDRVARARELRARHSVENQWDLLTAIGVEAPSRERYPAQMVVDAGVAASVRERLVRHGVSADAALVIMHVSAGNPFRRWPLESFADVAATLAQASPKVRVIITSGPSEAGAAQQVIGSARARLPEDRREAVLECGEFSLTELRALTDLDDARGDYEAAIGNLGLYLEAGGRGELEVFRRRAELYGKAGDAMNALLQVETGLTYNGSDADLLKKKDSYYFSVTEEKLRSVREKVAGFFDVAYCVKKASAVLNAKTDDPDMLDWAVHLATLAAVVQPQANGVRLVRARCLMRKGDRDTGVSILEDIRESKKGSGDDEDAWYAATKILGELYLDEYQKPELAIAAFKDYKAYLKAGADTHYQLGRAYEATGDVANAIREYKTVTAFEGHPRYWDAKDALRRLGKE